jgi:ribosomal protein S2
MFLKPKSENSILLDKLVSENCLLLGQKSAEKKNNEKNYFIVGRRNGIEVFDKNKIKFLLQRMYPLISGFYRTKLRSDDVKFFFATTNTSYLKIIENAASQCGMSFYGGR